MLMALSRGKIEKNPEGMVLFENSHNATRSGFDYYIDNTATIISPLRGF